MKIGKKKNRKKFRMLLISAGVLLPAVLLLVFVLQKYWAHREEPFFPEYEKVTLTTDSDYETIFFQTGLGQPAAERLLKAGEFQTILDLQDRFFWPGEVLCTSLLGWFTREDRTVNEGPREFVDLQPGDILLTLSTHSFGWRHGHAALVLDEDTTLESMVWGTDSCFGEVDSWNSYSNCAVLRVKDATTETGQQTAEYGRKELHGVPYHISAGFIGNKAPETDAPQFGVQCVYLVWYAWKQFGYDLDSDRGRLVTTYDLLHSEYLEVVQIFGMDPKGVYRAASAGQRKCGD